MIDSFSAGVTQALTEVDLAICGTYRGQTELRERLGNELQISKLLFFILLRNV